MRLGWVRGQSGVARVIRMIVRRQLIPPTEELPAFFGALRSAGEQSTVRGGAASACARNGAPERKRVARVYEGQTIHRRWDRSFPEVTIAGRRQS